MNKNAWRQMSPFARSTVWLVLVLLAGNAQAVSTDLATEPLANASSAAAKPNVMFTLDDSGSMNWSFAPDTTYNFQDYDYGAVASQCNPIYYNPNVTYKPPVKADGSSYPDSSFTAAWKNGFDTSDGTVNLSNNFRPYDTTSSWNYKDGSDYDGLTSKAAFYYTYTGSQVASGANYSNTNSTFYKECNSGIGGTPGKNVFTLKTVSSTSGPGATDERTNFANWYSYYRTRMLLMKSGVGRAFSGIDSGIRVGFNTINYTGVSSSDARFLNIADFDGTQKSSWYDKLYAAGGTSSTPLRTSLSKVGRIYAGKLLTGSDDPVKYSCQRNYAILSTDGYWNDSGTVAVQMDGTTAVGEQDGATGVTRPSLDANKTANTLADVAYYYYHTDLRSGTWNSVNWDNNNVPSNGTNTATDDVAQHQHMTTFTVGLGVDGTLSYRSDYKTATTGDYYQILTGSKNWPVISSGGATTVDDLWHAAVNGRGYYYSAKDPDSLVSGLTAALTSVKKVEGSAAAAATSSLNPVAGDNYAYVASYTTVQWTGELEAYTIDTTTGALATTPSWKAAGLLENKTSVTSSASRVIYKYDSAAAGKIESFVWANLNATEQGYFNDAVTTGGSYNLTQLGSWTSDQVSLVGGSGATLVEYLRGHKGYENQTGDLDGDGDNDSDDAKRRLYRDRTLILGDIVHTQPVYVKGPPFNYADPGYLTGSNGQTNSGFKSSNSGRTAVVYAGANDGMLHAFDATTGQEKWAYIPPQVLPNIWKLADSSYSVNHRFYVDGPITIGDVCVSSCSTASAVWKTILVGGLGAGGRGFYALDVTDPESPKALWNFDVANDSDVGYSYGNPIITKRKYDGKWVVLLTSGYNNTGPGDGEGHLFVLDAATGSVMSTGGKLDTGVGDTGTPNGPSGLAKLANWVDDFAENNTSQYVYGGDLFGNMWRFDLDANDVGRVASLINSGKAQPISVRPDLMQVDVGGSKKRVLLFGTGRYLGTTDLVDTNEQSFYAIVDNGTDWGNVRTSGQLVDKTLGTVSGTVPTRTTSTGSVDWATQAGWMMDLPDSGERVTVDPVLVSGTVVFSSIVPTADACDSGGYSWFYYVDADSGNAPTTSVNNEVGKKITGSIVVGVSVVTLQNGKEVAIITKSDGSTETRDVPLSSGTPGSKRVSWKEIMPE